MSGLDDLREIALDQHGFVTRGQAVAAGVTDADLSKMVSRCRIGRPVRGVYRVPGVAQTPWDAYHLPVLWTGEARACLSHETALEVWEITESLPEVKHVTVGRGRRLRRSDGEGFVVHYQDLEPREHTWNQGLPVVVVATALIQCVEYGVSTRVLKRAGELGLQRGLLTPAQHEVFLSSLAHRDGA